LRLVSIAAGLVALFSAGVAHAETWILIQNPDPGYRRFKLAVRTDNLERSGSQLTVQFLIVEKGEVTAQNEPILGMVWGDVNCDDPSLSNAYLRKEVSAGENPRLLKEVDYTDTSKGSISLSTAEAPVVALFCQGVPSAYKVLNGSGGDAAVELLKWSAGS
jgi:hypothetical protein